MRHIFSYLMRWLRGNGNHHKAALSPSSLTLIARQLAATDEREYSCDDAYRLLDQFAEAVSRGEDVARLMPLVQKHLEMCRDCREEFEALLRILGAESVAP